MNGNAIYRSCFLPNGGENTIAYWWQNCLIGLSLGEILDNPFPKFMHYIGGDSIIDCRNGQYSEVMELLEQEMSAYYNRKLTVFTVPIALYGTPFQKKIWTALLSVPYGTTITYSQLAVQAGVQGARATGSAVGANPIAIVVPCHRVLPKGGAVGNYSTGRGTATKQALLELEGSKK